MPFWMLFIGFIVIAGVIFCIYEWYEHAFPKRQCYQIQEQSVSLRLLVLSDLHCNPFLLKNTEFLERLRMEKPDGICIAGDAINKYDGEKNFAVLPFLQELSQIAPVYYSYGNHESKWQTVAPEEFSAYKEQVLKMGIHFLDNEAVCFKKGNQTIQMIGFTLPREMFQKGRRPQVSAEMMESVRTQIRPDAEYSILLAHSPEYIELYEQLPIQLVCSGHLHGGLVRLPFLGGLVSPQLRPPMHTKGLYERKNLRLLVSAGLGSHTIWMRVWNRIEYICLEIMCNEKGNTYGNTSKTGSI